MSTGAVLHFVEYPLQIVVLLWMAVLYAIKVRQLARLPMPYEKAPPKGDGPREGLRWYTSPLKPWSMDSCRKHFGRWAEFTLYHLGVAASLATTFALALITMPQVVRDVLAILIIPAAVLSVVKLTRRIARAEIRIVSTIDDYVALVGMEAFFITGIFALFTDTPSWQIAFFLVTAVMIAYVPFSKISHYVYFFFSRFLTGKRYGHRGVYREGRTTWA